MVCGGSTCANSGGRGRDKDELCVWVCGPLQPAAADCAPQVSPGTAGTEGTKAWCLPLRQPCQSSPCASRSLESSRCGEPEPPRGAGHGEPGSTPNRFLERKPAPVRTRSVRAPAGGGRGSKQQEPTRPPGQQLRAALLSQPESAAPRPGGESYGEGGAGFVPVKGLALTWSSAGAREAPRMPGMSR